MVAQDMGKLLPVYAGIFQDTGLGIVIFHSQVNIATAGAALIGQTCVKRTCLEFPRLLIGGDGVGEGLPGRPLEAKLQPEEIQHDLPQLHLGHIACGNRDGINSLPGQGRGNRGLFFFLTAAGEKEG